MQIIFTISLTIICIFIRHAYRLAGSFNNFHGRLTAIFYLLSDDKVGSTPRFAPGSKAKSSDMEVDEVEVLAAQGTSGTVQHTPLRGLQQKRKAAGEVFSGSSASKIKPT